MTTEHPTNPQRETTAPPAPVAPSQQEQSPSITPPNSTPPAQQLTAPAFESKLASDTPTPPAEAPQDNSRH